MPNFIVSAKDPARTANAIFTEVAVSSENHPREGACDVA